MHVYFKTKNDSKIHISYASSGWIATQDRPFPQDYTGIDIRVVYAVALPYIDLRPIQWLNHDLVAHRRRASRG